jgi:hypothetical protein
MKMEKTKKQPKKPAKMTMHRQGSVKLFLVVFDVSVWCAAAFLTVTGLEEQVGGFFVCLNQGM